MHVELRWTQIGAMLEAVAHHAPALLAVIDETVVDSTVVTEQIRLVHMPAIGWKNVEEALRLELYLPNGRVRGRPKFAMRKVMQNVAVAVAKREGHPALRRLGVEGHSYEPVWAYQDGDQFSPYPNGQDIVLLQPRPSQNGPVTFTTWVADYSDPMGLSVVAAWERRFTRRAVQ